MKADFVTATTLPNTYAWPDAQGRFGPYGGRFVAETLMPLIHELDAAYAESVVAGVVNTQEAAKARLEAFAKGTAAKVKPQ